MSRQWPASDIPEGRTVVDEGIHKVQVEAIDEGASKRGNLMYTTGVRIVEGPWEGAVLYEYNNIGTDEDPQARDPKTWIESIGARQLRHLFMACEVPAVNDIDVMRKQAVGRQYLQQIRKKIEPDKRKDGTDNPYKGNEVNVFGRRWRIGAAVPASAPPPAMPAGGEPLVKSPFTGELIPRSQLALHMKQYTGDDE